MSAIYGQIDLFGRKADESLAKSFENYYSDFAVDSVNTIINKNAFLGLAKQNFYEGAEKERHLYENEDVIFTTDAFIDNGMEPGFEGIKDLRGAFSFACYLKKENKVILAVDHFAQRCLFYYVNEGRVYFSTLMLPIVKLTGLKFKDNERWIMDSISMRSPIMITEPRETPVAGICKVVSGSIVEISLDDKGRVIIDVRRYYDPAQNIKVDKRITLKQSEELARETMDMVIKRILAHNTTFAAQLSCGLDSSTVACIAAKNLAKEGKELYSYTSVPDKAAGLSNRGGVIYDETEGVMKITEAYPNIKPTFVDTANRNYIKEVDEIVRTWELPCKSQQNAIWVDEIAKQASKAGCKVMFTGATGNCTISAGDVLNSAFYYLKHFRIVKFYHIFDECRELGVSRKRLFKVMLKNWISYYSWYFKEDEKDCYRLIATKREVGEYFDLTRRLQEKLYHNFPFYSLEEMHRQMYMMDANAQIGEIDTKLSLKYGILNRDPMRTPEVVEMCLKLPMECFASNDYDRRLVRVGMEGIVPKEIRHDVLRRGRQSGDNIYKLAKVWETDGEQIKADILSDELAMYLDKEKIMDCFEKIEASGVEDNSLDAMLIVDLLSMRSLLRLIHQ